MVQLILSQKPEDINTRDKLGRTPVMVAAMKQQVTVFDFLVSQGCDLTAVDNNNDTVLHVACDGGSIAIVTQLVVNHTCDIESRGAKGMTPLMRSALHGHRDIFDLLVSKGCDVDKNMNNILHVTCSGGHVDMVKYVLKTLKVDIESRSKQEMTPIMIAAHRGHLEVLIFLANSGSNLTVTVSDKYNILHLACFGGHVHVVKHILDKMLTDIESKADTGWTPVMCAVRNSQISVVEFLVGRGCNLHRTDDFKNTLLHIACMSDNVDMIKYILTLAKIGKDSRGAYEWTPVMTAASFGHMSVVKYLVSIRCDLSTQDSQGNNILHAACMSGKVDIVRYIISQINIEKDSRGAHKQTPLMTAVSFGHMTVVKYLVSIGCDLSVHDNEGNNILHVACRGGNVDMVKYIFTQMKTEKESRGAFGWTPIMTAASGGYISVVKYLVSMGCKLSVVDYHGNNILHLTCRRGNVDMVKYIVSQTGIRKDSTGEYSRTPLMSAASFGNMAVVKFLVSSGCKLLTLDSRRNNILHIACISGNVDTVKYIFSLSKIGKESRGAFGRTPLMAAASLGRMAVFKYLVSKGCSLSKRDSHGNSILHIACMSGNVDFVQFVFLKMKTGKETKGQYGWTPMMTAASYGHVSVVRYLVERGCKLSTVSYEGKNILQVACGRYDDLVKYLMTLQSWSVTC